MNIAAPGALPTQAETIATYSTYAEAQRAVDYLSDNKFPVEAVTIVGADLRSVEKVTGRLTWWKSALYGAGTGAWLGLFVGMLLALFTPVFGFWLRTVLFCAFWGALFGLVYGLITYALSGGQRDFTSVQAILASKYDVMCATSQAAQARQLIEGMPSAASHVPPQPGPAQSPPSTTVSASSASSGPSARSGPSTGSGPSARSGPRPNAESE